jgi:SAM-dependent methyltransferase
VTAKPYLSIVSHYESCLARHGDTHLGVDWPKAEDVGTRHEIMLGVIADPPPEKGVRLLDFGCGASHLNEYIVEHGLKGIEYTGLDLSERFVELSRAKFPQNTYYCLDVLAEDTALPRFDYAVMSGVFTEKVDLTFDAMLGYFQQMVRTVFGLVEIGLAFNVMSKHVDWERDDLFHLPFDVVADFLTRELSRHFVIRSDYGLYEYTVYVYR